MVWLLAFQFDGNVKITQFLRPQFNYFFLIDFLAPFFQSESTIHASQQQRGMEVTKDLYSLNLLELACEADGIAPSYPVSVAIAAIAEAILMETSAFHTMTATQCWCLESSLLYHILCPSSVVLSPNPVHLTLASPRMSHWYCFNSWVSSCTFPQSCREPTFHVSIVVPSFGSLMHSRCWSGARPIWHVVSLLHFCHILSVGLRKAWRYPSPLQVSQNWWLQTYKTDPH